MAISAGRERTKADWEKVEEGAGLKLDEILVYDEEVGDSVIAVKLL